MTTFIDEFGDKWFCYSDGRMTRIEPTESDNAHETEKAKDAVCDCWYTNTDC